MFRFPVQRTRSRRVRLGCLAAACVAAGGLSATVVVPSAAGAATKAKPTASVISTAESPKLGTILVAGDAAVYTRTAGPKACSAKCRKIWPPVLLPKGVTTASAGTGVDAAKLGTVPAGHGALQVTYAGSPLFWFAAETSTGQARGTVTDKWGTWSAVAGAASGTPATGESATDGAATGGTPTGGGATGGASTSGGSAGAGSTGGASTGGGSAGAGSTAGTPAGGGATGGSPETPATSPPAPTPTNPPAPQPTDPPDPKPRPTTPNNGGIGF